MAYFWWLLKKYLETFPDLKWQHLGNGEQETRQIKVEMAHFWWFLNKNPKPCTRPEVALSRQRQTIHPSNQNINGQFLINFQGKSWKISQTGSNRISSTMNDRPMEPKLKWPIFDYFWRKMPKSNPDREWPYLVKGNDTPIEPKLKWPIFDDFRRNIPKITRDRKWP
jgi:hypothetical protein